MPTITYVSVSVYDICVPIMWFHKEDVACDNLAIYQEFVYKGNHILYLLQARSFHFLAVFINIAEDPLLLSKVRQQVKLLPCY